MRDYKKFVNKLACLLVLCKHFGTSVWRVEGKVSLTFQPISIEWRLQCSLLSCWASPQVRTYTFWSMFIYIFLAKHWYYYHLNQNIQIFLWKNYVTQQNSYFISHLLGTVTTQWLPLWRCSHCSLVPNTVTTEQWLHRTHTLLGICYHGAYVEICLLGT